MIYYEIFRSKAEPFTPSSRQYDEVYCLDSAIMMFTAAAAAATDGYAHST